MDAPYSQLPAQTDKIVYVRPVEVASLPEPLREQAGERRLIYAVHDSDGQQLALVAERNLAFELAREHDYAPMSVH